MKTATRETATERRRGEILKAALDCFTERGVQATTIEEIRARSGASTGSIYHHFTNKEQLAGELYLHGLDDYQRGLMARLTRARTPESGIKAIVSFHLEWIGANPDLARFLFHTRQSEFVTSVEARIRAMNQEFFRALFDWLKPHITAGQIIKLPADLYAAILIGPCQEFARHWLAGRVKTDLSTARRVLAEAAWRALCVPAEKRR